MSEPSETSQDPGLEPLIERLTPLLEDEHTGADALARCLSGEEPARIALALDRLDPAKCRRVLQALEDARAAEVLTCLAPRHAAEVLVCIGDAQFKRMLDLLPPREAARIAAEAPRRLVEAARPAHPDVAADAGLRAAYPEGSAGRLMTGDYVRLRPDMTVEEALDAVRRTDPDTDIPDDLFAVDIEPSSHGHGREKLKGVLSIRSLTMIEPQRRIADFMATDIVTVAPEADDDVAASLLSRHKFLTLPVVDQEGYLVGVIPSDDLMHVVVARLHRRLARAVGTDAAAMEDATPLKAARLRVPWLLGTMLLELGAGVVIDHFDKILEKIILLASFMPVISAVAGNVGLQAAAITVRGLDTGQMSLGRSGVALLKESSTTVIMGAVCAFVLGTIGVIWSRHLMFGVVIAVALGCSMLTACLMGTIIPMVSKKLGFDPATTAGPFETAFQDIIGFGVFLALATLLLK